MIKCNKCNEEKNIKDFYKTNHPSHVQGYITPCKLCLKNQQKIKYTGDYHKNRLQNLSPEQKLKRTQQLTENAKIRRKDPNTRLKEALRARIYNKMKSNKTQSSIEQLGCTIDQYKIHLEYQFNSEMNWDNWGTYWEIDHIVPLSKGGTFHFSNTQPLTITENRKKSNRIPSAS
jgi:CRISPR/Cas system Type II protein with McrA/HNH and RuvC-like nuclease domain